MNTTPTPTLDRPRINAIMNAFRYGGRVDDLGKVDDRWAGSDDNLWTAGCDGATLAGLAPEYRGHLIAALEAGYDERAAVKHAYNATIAGSAWFGPQDLDQDWMPLEPAAG